MTNNQIMKGGEGGSDLHEARQALSNQDNNPNAMELIASAISKGADGNQVQQLIELVKFNDERNAMQAFNAAFTMAQAEFPAVMKASKVDFTSPKGRTHYDYASFKDIVSTIRPVLIKHGLSFRHEVTEEGGIRSVRCILAHVMGHSEGASLSAPIDKSGNKNDIQAIGSSVTYLKRYTLEAVTGVVTTDDDDDAQSAGADVISDKQHSTLVDLVNASGANESEFCAFFKIDSLESLPSKSFNKACAMLRKKMGGKK